MNVLQVSFADPFGSQAGGAEAVIRELLKRLTEEGSVTSDIVFASNSDSTRRIETGRLIGLQVPSIGILPRGSTAIRKIIYNARISKFIDENKTRYDIVHFHGDNGDSSTLDELNSITTFHGFSSTYAETRNPIMKQITHLASSRYEISKVKYSARLVAVSAKVKSEIQKYTGTRRKINVIYNGIDAKRFTPVSPIEKAVLKKELGLDTSKKYILFVGLDAYRKGLDIAEKTMKSIRNSNICLLVLGLDRGISDRDAAECVSFLGWQSEEDKIKYYQASDLLFAPSRYEGFSVTLLEAMSCGVPVVGSRMTGLEEISSGKDAIVMDTSDPVRNAEVIDSLLSNENQRSEISINARTTAMHYDWDKIANSYSDIYHSF